MTYILRAPETPGATPTIREVSTLRDARELAAAYRARRDLRGQDVRIEREDGTLVEYAGPAR